MNTHVSKDNRCSPLGKVAKFIRGITFKPSDVVPFATEDSIVCMRTKNVQEQLDQSDLLSVPLRFCRRDEQRLREGDILVSTANSWERVGGSSWVPPLDYLATAGGFISILRGNSSVFPRYLYYWMTLGATQHKLRHCGRQTTNISNMSIERALQLELPLPALAEQKRIAEILDKADAMRRKRRNVGTLTEDFLRAQFVELFGDPYRNPKSWPVKKLEEDSQLQSGVTKGRKLEGKKTVDVPYMRVWNVQDAHLRLGDIKNITVLETDVEKYRLETGDLLLTEGGDPDQLGRGAIWYSPIPVCIHQNHIFRVRANRDLVVPEFLSAMIGSEFCKRYFLKMAKQTTGIASINMRQLKACPVLLPPLNLQEKFSQIEKRFKQSVETLDKRFAEADTLFDSIAQKAFKGEL